MKIHREITVVRQNKCRRLRFCPPSQPSLASTASGGCTGQGSHVSLPGLRAGVVMDPAGGFVLISVWCCARSWDRCRAMQGTFLSAGGVRATSPHLAWDLSTPVGRGEGPSVQAFLFRVHRQLQSHLKEVPEVAGVGRFHKTAGW